MAWWNKQSEEAALQRWDCAKEITAAEAANGTLPLGWYIYRDGYMWYGLKPNAERTALERSYHRSSPKELEDWLGIPVPDSARTEAISVLDALISQTASVPRSPEPSDEERYREDAQLAHEIEEDILDTEDILDAAPPGREPSSEEPGQPEEKSKGRTRNNELHFWFSDAELMRFRRRVERSGLNQSEFLRRAALTGKIVIEERDPVNIAILDELTLIRAELGRQGGLLKMIIKPNEGQRELAPEEWDELIQTVRYMEKTKKRLGALEEKI